MNNATIAVIVIVLLVLLGGVYFFTQRSLDNRGLATTTPTTTIPGLNGTATGTTGGTSTATSTGTTTATTQGAVKQFTVTAKNFTFAPATLTVNRGDRVRITLQNNEGFHDLVIDEFNARTKQIQGVSQDTVEFVADKSGSFEYYCSVGQHRQMGMVGTLIVR